MDLNPPTMITLHALFHEFLRQKEEFNAFKNLTTDEVVMIDGKTA